MATSAEERPRRASTPSTSATAPGTRRRVTNASSLEDMRDTPLPSPTPDLLPAPNPKVVTDLGRSRQTMGFDVLGAFLSWFARAGVWW